MNLQLFVVLSSVVVASGCKNLDARRAISYRLVKADAKSEEAIMTRRRVANVVKCMDFAENRNALAFNFERSTAAEEPLEANCFLLRCPESNSLTQQLTNRTGVDYYSAYPNNCHEENTNFICVEKVGLFVLFSSRLNFTEARASCQKIHGHLAEVTSEARSRGIALMVNESVAFVGLSNEGNQRVWKNEFGDPLACFDYRAWDSGEPSHSRGCVGIIQTDGKTDPVWRVMSCGMKLPYICEISRLESSTNHRISARNTCRT